MNREGVLKVFQDTIQKMRVHEQICFLRQFLKEADAEIAKGHEPVDATGRKMVEFARQYFKYIEDALKSQGLNPEEYLK